MVAIKKIPELIECGYIRKSHGHRGELSIALSSSLFEEMEPDFLFINVDEISVPFEVEDIHGGYPNLIIKLKRINSDTEATSYKGHKVFIEKPEYTRLLSIQSEESDLSIIKGFKVYHIEGKLIGTVIEIDDLTANILLIIKNSEDQEILIPLVDEWINDIDYEKRELTLSCPIDLLTL